MTCVLNKFTEALQKHCLKTGQDAAQAPHEDHQFTKYSQYIICMDLLKFPGHWCNVRISCPFFLCKHVKWVIWANRPLARKSKKMLLHG